MLMIEADGEGGTAAGVRELSVAGTGVVPTSGTKQILSGRS